MSVKPSFHRGREEEEEEEEEEEAGVCWPMGKPCPPGTARLAG